MHDKLREDLRALVAEIAEIESVPDAASFKELGIDSMMGVEIVAAVERQYKIKIEDAELEQFTTLERAFSLVKSKIGNLMPLAAAG